MGEELPRASASAIFYFSTAGSKRVLVISREAKNPP
jgi:hypothetical protein